jgi:hypothetical protein
MVRQTNQSIVFLTILPKAEVHSDDAIMIVLG